MESATASVSIALEIAFTTVVNLPSLDPGMGSWLWPSMVLLSILLADVRNVRVHDLTCFFLWCERCPSALIVLLGVQT
jgi:hypothetical protein